MLEKSLLNSYTTIVNAISSAEKYPYLMKVGVFGSHARGEVNKRENS